MSAVSDGPKGPYERIARALLTEPDAAERLYAALGLEKVSRIAVVQAASANRSIDPRLHPDIAYAVGVSYGLAIGLSLADSADLPDTSDAPGVAASEGMGV